MAVQQREGRGLTRSGTRMLVREGRMLTRSDKRMLISSILKQLRTVVGVPDVLNGFSKIH